MPTNITDEEVTRFMRQFKLLLAGVVALFVVPLIIYAVFMQRRLDAFAETLQYSGPQTLLVDDAARTDLFHLATSPVQGQVVYVPAYSHIYHGDGAPYLLTITLSVRNTSMDEEIVVKAVRYFDTKGKLVKSYLPKPVRLPALGTTEILIARDDATGGSGANFLVEWFADNPVTAPIIEAVMIDTDSQQGISFARRGSVIRESTSQANESAK
ncbi:DUF3124 domain-containing protein [Stieleria marina]|uniref:DUF3124 domain-containing protein n=1 Tax=Stieleria marina TaxID=1930275 RepID=A0A517NVJ2_9BACT|nr:hypothetical protein K239x_31310 [Planctomycetes bacterium K23_9]